MTTPNNNSVAPIADVPTYDVAITSNDVALTLVKLETKAKGDKTPIGYWSVNLLDLAPAGTSDADKPAMAWEAIGKAIGYQMAVEKLQGKLNADIKAAQCEDGKDAYTMAEKLTFAREYVTNGFGLNKAGGGKWIAALKNESDTMKAALAELAVTYQKMAAEKDPVAKLALITRIGELVALSQPPAK